MSPVGRGRGKTRSPPPGFVTRVLPRTPCPSRPVEMRRCRVACAPSERVCSRGVAACGDSASELFAACCGLRPPTRSRQPAATRIPRRLRPGRGGGAAPRGGGGAESGAGHVESWDGVLARGRWRGSAPVYSSTSTANFTFSLINYGAPTTCRAVKRGFWSWV